MMKNGIKGYIVFILLAAISMGALHIARAAAAEPGSSEDPIVSQSYVDSKISELKTYIDTVKTYTDQKVNELNTKIGSLGGTAQPSQGGTGQTPAQGGQQSPAGGQGEKFVRVDLKPGQRLIANAYTEIIVRMGQLSAITTKNGGLSDVTVGVDISEGNPVPSNHLIIVPADDGRGLRCLKDAIVLVKGGYRVE